MTTTKRKDINAYRIERKGKGYHLYWKDMHLGFAMPNFKGLWFWSTWLPGRKGGRKGCEDVLDALAACLRAIMGVSFPKSTFRNLLEAGND